MTIAPAALATQAKHTADPTAGPNRCECCTLRRPVFELNLTGTTFRVCQPCVLPEDTAAAHPLSEHTDRPLDFGPEWICATAIKAAAAAFEVTPERLLEPGRLRKVADARIVAMASAQAAGATPRAIAAAFERDHSTVSHALRRARSDARLSEAVASVVAVAFHGRLTTSTVLGPNG